MNNLHGLRFKFDPFKHLDSTNDVHLQEYLVIPKAMEIALSDQPVAIFAQPGGGKSALRIYTANSYKESRGVHFPVTYIPDDYSTEKDFHFWGIKKSVARVAFMYLASYPDLFFTLSNSEKQNLKRLLLDIPLGLDFNLQVLRDANSLFDLEQSIGVPAFSSLPKLDHVHHRLANELAEEDPSESLPLDSIFRFLKDTIGVKSIHILVDGLDGFMETQTSDLLLAWIAPLLNVLEKWERKGIYLKFFLPMDISDAPMLINTRTLRAATLNWDDHLLSEVIRRRVFVATDGIFDSLDAVSALDVRNVELTLVRQLEEKEKLPRQIIIKCQHLLRKVVESKRTEILHGDLFSLRELSYDTSI